MSFERTASESGPVREAPQESPPSLTGGESPLRSLDSPATPLPVGTPPPESPNGQAKESAFQPKSLAQRALSKIRRRESPLVNTKNSRFASSKVREKSHGRSRFANSIHSGLFDSTQAKTPGDSEHKYVPASRTTEPSPMRLMTTEHPQPTEAAAATPEDTVSEVQSFDCLPILDQNYFINKQKWTPFENLTASNPIISSWKLTYLEYRQSLCSMIMRKAFFYRGFSTSVGGIFIFLAVLGVFVGVLSAAFNPSTSHSQKLQLLNVLNCFFMTFVFIFACRNSLWQVVFGVSHEKISFWHKRISVITVLLTSLEVFLADRLEIAPFIQLVVLYTMVVSSVVLTYLNLVSLFKVTHRILLAMNIILLIATNYQSGVVVVSFFVIDHAFRFYWIRKYRGKFKLAIAEMVAREMVQISFARENLEYRAGQFMYLLVPEVSFWELKPFYFSSSPFHQTITFNIKVVGDWTHRLAKLCEHESIILEIFMEGPYGSPTLHHENSDTKIVVGVAAGIEVCPILSKANAFIDQAVRGRPLKRVLFFWSVRDFETVKATFKNCDILSTYQRIFPELQTKSLVPLDQSLVYMEVYLSSLLIQNIIPLYIEEDFAHLKNLLLSQRIKPVEIVAKIKEEMAATGARPEEVLVMAAGPALLTEKLWKLLRPLGIRVEFYPSKT